MMLTVSELAFETRRLGDGAGEPRRRRPLTWPAGC